MSEKRYILPAGMFAAFMCGYNICWTSYDGDERNKHFTCMEAGVKAVLRFLAENPIVPTEEQVERIHNEEPVDAGSPTNVWQIRNYIKVWQWRMFLAPEPQVPKEIEDLLCAKSDTFNKHFDDRIIEAFRRGQKAGNR
jgi:hypothetical protein